MPEWYYKSRPQHRYLQVRSDRRKQDIKVLSVKQQAEHEVAPLLWQAVARLYKERYGDELDPKELNRRWNALQDGEFAVKCRRIESKPENLVFGVGKAVVGADEQEEDEQEQEEEELEEDDQEQEENEDDDEEDEADEEARA